jgi:5-methylcytosine-specific restriction endonuclease McrA
MAIAAFKTCGRVGCPTLVKSGAGGYCPKHLVQYNQRVNRERSDDELRSLYKTARWLKFRDWFLAYNVICQRIRDGIQCERIATDVHHRRGLREHPEDLIDPEHCVALCKACHHKHSGDTAEDVYAPTITHHN